MNYEPVIGLEIHSELKTRTKMFCASLNDLDEPQPNVNICPICMGHPGTLPVPNRRAIESVIRVGLAVNGEIAEVTRFDRKNYFYPDLPKGYQISQYDHPIVRGGWLEIPGVEGQPRRIRIQRIHLEEDTGRSIHDAARKVTLLDFNRAGIPLMELVTEPDLRSALEVRQFAESLQSILRYLEASDANMEKGEMRIEANVSLRPRGSATLGTKVELKNINSFRFAELAVEAEIRRQAALLAGGNSVAHETRGWDEKRGETVAQRSKEEAHDYRYFPEPDIPPLVLSPTAVEELRRGLPELPAAKLKRFSEEFGLESGIARVIVGERRLAAFYEAAASELTEWLKSEKGKASESKAFSLAANYLTTDVAGRLAGAKMTPENFAELITYLAAGKISSRTAKDVLGEMISSGGDPSVIIEERGLWQISEAGTLIAVAEAVIAANPKTAADYRSGKREALQFLVGRAMKESRAANPEAVRRVLEEKLKERD